MGACLIFCAGGFDGLARPVEKSDVIIAADGGVRHVDALGLKADVILGDFDSLGYVPAGAEIFPAEKDDTDAMLAARRGLDLGCREFMFYGGLEGKRLDHTVANFQTLQFLAEHGARGYLIGKDQTVSLVKNGTLRFPAGARGTVSVFCLGPDARGVTLEGLHYPLKNGTLTAGFPLGVSNHFTGAPASISVEDGSLLVIWDTDNTANPLFSTDIKMR